MNDIKNWIREKLLINGKIVSRRCKKQWFEKNNYINEYNDIINITSFLDSPTLSQRLWHIYNNNLNKYKCCNPSCNNTTTFFTFTRGYLNTCSPMCAQYDPQTINKIKSTNIRKYGTEYGLSNRNVINKRIKTIREKYGVDNVSQLADVSDKKKQTCLKNYGKKWFLERGDLLRKIIFDKYGVENVLQLEEIKNRVSKTKLYDFYDYICSSEKFSGIKPLFNREQYNGCCVNHDFLCKKCNTKFVGKIEDGNIPRCIICYPKNGNSLFQKQILEYIESIYTGNVIENDKKILNGLEIDIYIPEKNIAIECDGLFWHGQLNGDKSKSYHVEKTIKCESKNIHLIHIFEDEWNNNTTIVKNKLRHILGKNNDRLYARKCIVGNVGVTDKKRFLNENHIQGNDNSKFNIGLYYDNELVAVMTFCKQRIFINDKNNRCEGVYELSRYATKKNIVGGASKLLKYFVRSHNPKKIISYADRRWTFKHNNLYKNIGFVEINDGTPNYWYFGKSKNYRRFHRFNFAKHTLNKKLEIFDENISEWENMKNNGWDRIWDCGNFKYEITFS